MAYGSLLSLLFQNGSCAQERLQKTENGDINKFCGRQSRVQEVLLALFVDADALKYEELGVARLKRTDLEDGVHLGSI